MKRFPFPALVVGLILLGFALRLYHLGSVPFRGDEAFTVQHWMRQPLSVTLADIATIDPQPPLAYAAFRGWELVVGDSELLARLLPALVSLLGIPALYALGHRLGGRKMGLLAAFLWAIHPLEIWHAQDARNYALWAAISAVALWLALRAVDKRRRVDWILYVFAALAAAYLYYLELFTLVVLNLYVFIAYWRDRRLLKQWVASQAVIGVVVGLWFVQPRLLFGSGYGGTTGGFDPQRLVTWFLPTLTFGQTLPDSLVSLVWPLLVVALLVGLTMLARRTKRTAFLLALLGIVPLLLLGIVSLKLNVFTPRYVLAAAPAYTLIIAGLLRAGFSPTDAQKGVPTNLLFVGRRFFASALLCGWILLSGYSLYNYYFLPEYAKAHAWPTLMGYLSGHASRNDMVIQAAADESYNFYYTEFGLPSDRQQLPANPHQSVDEISGLLEADRRTHRSIWLVAQTFPDWPNAGVVENWLGAHMQLVRNSNANGLRIQQYMNWEVSPGEISSTPLATFGDTVELVGAYVSPPEPTGELTIWLDWRPLKISAQPLKIFVHLLGAVNPASGSTLWTQDDQLPQDGRVDATTWTVGDVFRDVYSLPLASVPPGDYTLEVGFYNPANGERVSVGSSTSYILQAVSLSP